MPAGSLFSRGYSQEETDFFSWLADEYGLLSAWMIELQYPTGGIKDSEYWEYWVSIGKPRKKGEERPTPFEPVTIKPKFRIEGEPKTAEGLPIELAEEARAPEPPGPQEPQVQSFGGYDYELVTDPTTGESQWVMIGRTEEAGKADIGGASIVSEGGYDFIFYYDKDGNVIDIERVTKPKEEAGLTPYQTVMFGVEQQRIYQEAEMERMRLEAQAKPTPMEIAQMEEWKRQQYVNQFMQAREWIPRHAYEQTFQGNVPGGTQMTGWPQKWGMSQKPTVQWASPKQPIKRGGG